MRRIVGTAGHIDHGKTSLVRALTGEDTDRLPEEKARGISIELGFASLQLADGTRAGVIDVPGHERFIRTMLAGAHGVDLVLFTVAADDGVMPQTVEHLDIVRLLGVEQAIFVITKSDLVVESRLHEVASDVARLAAATRLAGSPVMPVSTVTGDGLPALRRTIERMLSASSPASAAGHAVADDHRGGEFFRLPVDRVFTVAGQGVVVTGTARGGVVRTGDAVRIVPGGITARVRQIQIHGETSAFASHGQRVALNLAGIELQDVQRGCTIADTRLTRATTHFDATLDVCASAERGIRNQQRVRVHVGTAERFGRIVLVGADYVAPSASAFCRIVLAEPLLVMRGDRYVVRDETARHTLGGGAILHPLPKGRVRRDARGVDRLQRLNTTDPVSLTTAFVADHRGAPVPLDAIAEFLNRSAAAARAVAAASEALRAIGDDEQIRFMRGDEVEQVAHRIVQYLGAFHDQHRLEPGCDIEQVRAAAAAHLDSRLFRLLVDDLAGEQRVVREGSRLRLPAHRVALSESEHAVAARVLAAIADSPLSPPAVDELQQATGIPRGALGDLLRLLEREQLIVKVGTGFYFLRESIDRARHEIAACADASGTITASSVRDRLGTTRKYTIPLLEYFDRTGLTIRVGNVHRLRNRDNR